jgi:hypothetical protein
VEREDGEKKKRIRKRVMEKMSKPMQRELCIRYRRFINEVRKGREESGGGGGVGGRRERGRKKGGMNNN